MQSECFDVVIVGGGTGGCAAALAASKSGLKVLMTEIYPWIGGQLTSQAVPPDEHPWIEQFGCTASYREYRNRVRNYYRQNYRLRSEIQAIEQLNPGAGWVSRLCHEPAIGHRVLQDMLAPYVLSGNLVIAHDWHPVAAERKGETVVSVTFNDKKTDRMVTIQADYFLDATELGDLLPLTETEYITGAESKAQTGEPNALDGDPDPGCNQGITWCFAMGYDPEGEHIIEKPAQYEFWRDYQPKFWPGPLLSWNTLHAHTGEHYTWTLFGKDSPRKMGLFDYRQVVKGDYFDHPKNIHDVSIINWPQNDYYTENIIDESEELVQSRLEDSKQLSLSLLYWLQTSAPRPDGGTGYPGLYMRPDITGTVDGFAQAPYIRESRRILAEFTVVEQMVGAASNPGKLRADSFKDSVGIGSYRIDLHPCVGGYNTIDVSSIPFEIPLGALIPRTVKNLIPCCKNIGVTHITNGCYRLHPVEWNIGEAAGYLAAFCLREKKLPTEVRSNQELFGRYQTILIKSGIEVQWPELRVL